MSSSANMSLHFGRIEKERKCETCSVSSMKPGVELRSCATCKCALYCSRECQKAHWKVHKTRCRPFDMLDSAPALEIDDPQVNPDRLKADVLASHLKAWKKCHDINFMVSCLHALGVHSDFDRIKTHFLHVKICARPEIEHEGKKEKYFRVVDATVVADKDTPWPQLIEPDQLPALRREEEESGRGSLAVVVLDFPGLSPSVLQFGSVRKEDIYGQTIPWWKEILITNVLKGETKNIARAVPILVR